MLIGTRRALFSTPTAGPNLNLLPSVGPFAGLAQTPWAGLSDFITGVGDDDPIGIPTFRATPAQYKNIHVDIGSIYTDESTSGNYALFIRANIVTLDNGAQLFASGTDSNTVSSAGTDGGPGGSGGGGGGAAAANPGDITGGGAGGSNGANGLDGQIDGSNPAGFGGSGYASGWVSDGYNYPLGGNGGSLTSAGGIAGKGCGGGGAGEDGNDSTGGQGGAGGGGIIVLACNELNGNGGTFSAYGASPNGGGGVVLVYTRKYNGLSGALVVGSGPGLSGQAFLYQIKTDGSLVQKAWNSVF